MMMLYSEQAKKILATQLLHHKLGPKIAEKDNKNKIAETRKDFRNRITSYR